VGEMATIPGVDLMAVGTWELSSGRATFTRADLQSAIEASTSCPAVGDPLIGLGHTDPRFDGEPAFGKVVNLRLSDNGTRLVGDLQVPSWLADSIHAAYPNRSVEGSYNYPCQMGHVHPFALTGLALLGITRPGVGNLAGLPQLQQTLAASSGILAPRITGTPHKTTGDDMDSRDNPWRALREGRISVATAAAWAGDQEREVIAHSHAQALRDAHQALDRGHQANYDADEFAKLFPPTGPAALGPDDTDETGDGAYTPGRKRQVTDIQQRAAAGGHVSDEELFFALYGRPAPRGYFEG
jgi:hypothetical protein